jgi:hypothetical protein
MINYDLVISRAALNDIEWYEDQRQGLSIDFKLCIEEGYEDITNNPLGFQLKYKDVRIKYISRFPYGINYIIRNNMIYILCVFHTSKNPKNWSERTKKD